ncbi:MAG: LamG-like jellyroll fold domain-containing protein, partial [Candidatus Neomarinimicrobiota bacterium]
MPVSMLAQNPGQALQFDGVDDYVSGATAGFPSGGSSRTMSLWFKITSQGSEDGGSLFIYGNGALASNFGLFETISGSTSYIRFVSRNDDVNPSVGNDVNDGNWHHAALVYDGSEFFAYVDGELQWSQTKSINTTLGSFSIGRSLWSTNFFDGFIDEVRIWNVARTQAQIQATMNDTLGPGYYETADSGLVAYYRFDADANDLTDNGNHGTVNGALFVDSDAPIGVPAAPQNLTAAPGDQQVTLSWFANSEIDFLRYRIYGGTTANPTTKTDSTTTGDINDTTKTFTGLTNGQTYFYRITAVDSDGNESSFSDEVVAAPVANPAGNALSFDGVDDYVSVSYVPDPTAYTIEAWVKPSDVTSVNIIVRTDVNGPTASWSHQLSINPEGRFQHYTFDGSGRSVAGSTSISSGSWYHVAAMATNNGDMRLYVNGVEEGTSMSVSTLWTGGDRYYFGSNSTGSDYFSGTIDEVRIWNVARTKAEIQADMNRALKGNETGLVGYWRFDESSGTTTYDGTPNGNNGTVNGGAQFVSSDAPIGVPSIPQNLTASPGNDQVTLAWSPNTEADLSHYLVYQSTTSGFTPAPTDSVARVNEPDTTVTITGLANNTTYFYRIAALDSGGNTSVFSREAVVTPVATLAGNALSFDGVDDYVEIGDKWPGGNRSITLSAWVKANAVASGLLWGTVGVGNMGLRGHFYIRSVGTGSPGTTTGYDGDAHIWLGADDGTSDMWWAGSTVVVENTWYHVAATYDSTTQRIRLYVNGSLDRDTTLSQPLDLGTGVRIGLDHHNDNYMNGFIDEVRIWNVARSQTEIQRGMSSRLQGNETGLVGYWRFDESTGTTTYDGTPNGNHGTLNGGATFVASDAPIGVTWVTAFTRITEGDVVNDGGQSDGGSWGDYDNDGDLDLFVANDNGNNFLYQNNGDGTFTRITTGTVVNDGGRSYGSSWGDYDNDGDLDLFVANTLGANNFLYQNNGDGTFTKMTTGTVVNDGGPSVATSWG